MAGEAVLLRFWTMAYDNPRQALQQAQRELDALGPRGAAEDRFWLALARARALQVLEDQPALLTALEQAQSEMLRLGKQATETQRRWYELQSISASFTHEETANLNVRMARLRESTAREGSPALQCEVLSLDSWMLQETGGLDEAWIVAEEHERCALRNGLDIQRASALNMMGTIVSKLPREAAKGRSAHDYFERAFAALGPAPLRFQRSLMEWDLARIWLAAQDRERAMTHLLRALQLSREIEDRAGIGSALAVMARLHLESAEPALALPLLAQAEKQLAGHDDGVRLVNLAILRIQALTALRRPAVLVEIERVRQLERPEMMASLRAKLARAMADGYASASQWPSAYQELRRANLVDEELREQARDGQVLRLQMRYDNALRDVVNAELRYDMEAAARALETQRSRARELWITVAILAAVLVLAALSVLRQARTRRVLADLALKDELTGAPNRRAITAYAHALVEQAQKLGTPLTLAMIDLDHFKQVNDKHGHDVGDELLRAFVLASAQVLRGQDRMGRWGGEEWLLVMPGTTQAELSRVFERLQSAYVDAVVPGLPVPHAQSFSMGVAELGNQAQTVNQLVKLADQRLYAAKQAGRDQFRAAA